jgi:hypothetical protein
MNSRISGRGYLVKPIQGSEKATKTSEYTEKYSVLNKIERKN